MPHNDENVHPFANATVIFSYSRAQAIEDGVLADVSETAREAGFEYPVAITTGVFENVIFPRGKAATNGESEAGRLWDVLWMCSNAIRWSAGGDTAPFEVIATDGQGRKGTHKLYAHCGPGDTAAPVITIMMVGED